MTHKANPTAAIIVIGDEILSGRTQDTNTNTIAAFLTERGIDLRETRTIPDEIDVIVRHVNELRAAYDHVFTTGGIGPTHDDITADAIAAAFGVDLPIDKRAWAVLDAHYQPGEFTEARQRMARIPTGGELIDNPVSRAPGIRMDNVYVMAGVPAIMSAMLASLEPLLDGGPPMLSATVTVDGPEGHIGMALKEIAGAHPTVSIGSYPYYREARYGTNLVIRGRDQGEIDGAVRAVKAMLTEMGIGFS